VPHLSRRQEGSCFARGALQANRGVATRLDAGEAPSVGDALLATVAALGNHVTGARFGEGCGHTSARGMHRRSSPRPSSPGARDGLGTNLSATTVLLPPQASPRRTFNLRGRRRCYRRPSPRRSRRILFTRRPSRRRGRRAPDVTSLFSSIRIFLWIPARCHGVPTSEISVGEPYA
jgi:hypothetical protein